MSYQDNIYPRQRVVHDALPAPSGQCRIVLSACGIFQSMDRLVFACLISSFFLIGLVANAAGQSTPVEHLFSQSYYQGLRDRGLFELAETLCLQELATENVTDSRKQFLSRQLAGTYAAHAAALPYKEGVELWEQADKELHQPGFPYYFNGERGILKAARVEQLYWLLLLEPQNQRLKTEFDQLWQEALNLLEWAAEKHSSAINVRTGDYGFDHTEAFYRWQLSRCDLLLLSAEIDEAAFPLQKLELQQARQQISRLSKNNLPEYAQLELRLFELKLLRLERDSARCQSQYEQLREMKLPAEIIQRATAIQARCLLDQNRPADAAELILEIAKTDGPLSAELEAIRLLGLIDMQRQVEIEGDRQLAADLQLEIEQRLQTLESRGEIYFSQLVRKQTDQRALQRRFGTAARELLSARLAVQNGQFPEAVKNYRTVINQLKTNANLTTATELVPEMLPVFAAADKESELIELLEQIWRSSPTQTEMEQVHLYWVAALGRNYLKNNSQQQLNYYQNALEDHLRRYPGQPTADEARWLLGELKFSRLQVVQALQQYQNISSRSHRWTSARLRQIECYRWIMQRLTDLKQPTTAWQASAIQLARSYLEDISINESLEIRQAELWLSAWQLLYESAEPVLGAQQHQLDELFRLTNQFRQSPFYDDTQQAEWQRVYHRTVIFRGLQAARSGDKQLASQLLLAELTQLDDPDEQFFVARQLSQQQWNDPQIEVAMAELILKLTAPTYEKWSKQPQTLSIEEQQKLLAIRASAEQQAGRSSRAIELWEQYRTIDPADRTVLMQLSQLLQACNHADCHRRRYELWQNEQHHLKPGTEIWLAGRYQLALAARDVNKSEEAAKILQVSLLLYPALGQSELRQQCTDLLSELTHSRP